MGYSGGGDYTLPAGALVADGTSIDAADLNTPLQDIETSLNLALLRDGRVAMSGNLAMGSNKLTGLTDGSAATDSATLKQVQNGIVSHATSVAGTADAIQVSFSPATTTWTSKELIRWTSGGANTVTAPTISKDAGSTTKTIKKGASAALAVGDTGASGYVCFGVYNGTDLLLLNPATENVTVAKDNTWTGANVFSGAVSLDSDIKITGGPLWTPGGRLTLETGVPVSSSDQTGKTTIYYAPYLHNGIEIYDGTRWTRQFFTELSQALSDTTKSPAAATTSSLYDMFVWNDSGTMRCTRGPAWSSSTARGTGAGTTELERLHGVLVNKVAITNGPAANRGVYVGTIATNGSTQCAVMLAPAAAAGGSANRIDVWNMYNRVPFSTVCRDSTNSWTQVTASTWRSANNSASNSVTLVAGLNEMDVTATYFGLSSNSGTVQNKAAVGLNSTSAFSGVPGVYKTGGATEGSVSGEYRGLAGLGSNTFNALEWTETGGTTNWYGDNNSPTNFQSGLFVSGQY